MHYLQKSILDLLRYHSPLSYTELMPDGIESSHFRYHLKQLISNELVNKDTDGSYRLTDMGQREVDYLSDNRTTIIRTPKTITYTLLTYKDSLFLLKKAKEPYRELYGMIGGKVHFGEEIRQAARREVSEKTGLDIELPDICGVADIRITKGDEVHSHAIAYVCRYELERSPDPLPPGLVRTNRQNLHLLPVIPDLTPLLDCISLPSPAPFVRFLLCKLD